ncbi:hypothetical protein [Bacillus massiliigorillae]|uniref:hypothetical protein n=1 Tax=Bacillus massiliigorillae TaxID=1243664 RepID=UPI00039C39C5|nr:hypothetical protein [Bacillus massiliigorillae]
MDDFMLSEFQLIQKALLYSYEQLEQEEQLDNKGMEQLTQAHTDLSAALSYYLQKKSYE